MSLSADEVYKVLSPLNNSTDIEFFINKLKDFSNKKPIHREAANNLAYYTTSLFFGLERNGLLHEGRRVVKEFIELFADLPISADKRWYFVEKALQTIKSSPELADDLLDKIIKNTYSIEHTYLKLVTQLAELGRIDLVLKLGLRSISLGYNMGGLKESSPAVKNIYNNNIGFKTQIDDAIKIQKEKELRFKNSKDFPTLLEKAYFEMTRIESFQSNHMCILELVSLADNKFKTEIEEFFKSGFNQLRITSELTGELINDKLYDILIRAVQKWNNPQLGALLMSEYLFVTDDSDKKITGHTRHYELTLTSGTIALALASLNYGGDLEAFDNFIKNYERRYQGHDFVMKTLYTKWLLKNDTDGILAFLNNPEKTKGISYAACAAADLNYKPAADIIKAKLSQVTNPVTKEVLKECLERLKNQSSVPLKQDRVILLFGEVTNVEMALGAESDNEFLKRAQAAEKNSELGVIYEVDETPSDD